MIGQRLDLIKRESAMVLVEYSNGLLDSHLSGRAGYGELLDNSMRLHYLYGIINSSRLENGNVFIGSTQLSGDDLENVFSKIAHYRGIFSDVDLAVYATITPDDGNTGGSSGGGGPSPSPGDSDFYRQGSANISGATSIVFSSQLSSSDYQVEVLSYISSNGTRVNVRESAISNRQLGQFTFTPPTGFTQGVLTYRAILNN